MQAGRAFGPGPRRAAATLVAAGALACAASGCGGSGPAQATGTRAASTATAHTGPSTPHVSRSLKAREEALHRQVEKALHQPDHAHYGGIPRDLRAHQAAPRNQILFARPGRTADAIQGISVQLRLASGAHALMTTVGPDVPNRDQGSFHNFTNATWAVTFARVHGRLPITPRAFAITDELGQTLTPRLTVLGGGRVPRSVPAGRPFTLLLHAHASIGNGKVRYFASGPRWLVEWDFDTETD